MKNKKKLIGVLNTLIMSWGSDTPPEAVWAANELIDFIESETDLKNLPRFTEEDPFSDLAKIQLELLTRVAQIFLGDDGNEHNYPCPVNWAEMPEWANFTTMDIDGEIDVWEIKPECRKGKLWVTTQSSSKVIEVGKYLGISLNVNNCPHHIWQRPE